MGHAIVGTLWMIGIAVVLTVPVGLVAAVYLDMTRTRPSRAFRTVVEAMTALPSILAGLFIYALWILTLGNQKSGLAAALALSVMMLPYMIRASDLALRLVPGTCARPRPPWVHRAGGASCRWSSRPRGRAWPPPSSSASPGGSGRPRRCCSPPGTPSYINADPLHGPMASLPLAALKLVQSGSPLYTEPRLRRGLVPPPAGHRPVRHGPEDRRVGTGPPVRPGHAPGP